MMTKETTTVKEQIPTTAESSAGKDSPGVIIFPPLLYIGTLLLGLVLNYFWPMPLTSGKALRIAGAGLVVASGMVASWGARTMRRAGTNVLPAKPTLTIVTDGPFRFSRNPLYLANAIVFVGLALIFNAVWPLFLLVPMLCVVHRGIIRREERYLETKFGETYLAYKARVRRWI
jgi:protein-S-isoprenylcysteine O-methyltransferase Ste14